MFQMDFARDRALIETEFKAPAWDPESGLPLEQLQANCRALFEGEAHLPIGLRRAHMLAYVLDNAQIASEPYEYFTDQLRHGGIALTLARETIEARLHTLPEIAETQPAEDCRAFTGERDFGHTCPDWRALLRLGYPGILARLREERAKAATDEAIRFFEESILVHEAVLRMMSRMADTAERRAGEHGAVMARNLRGLTLHAPETFHEALQFSMIVYWVQSAIEGACVRSLGRFDDLFGPYYDADLASGRATEAELKELLRYYFCRWNAANITANIPITLCGWTDRGHDAANALTRAILDIYGELDLISPKFHIRVNEHTPRDVIEKVCDLIRRGMNSFVFCNDDIVVKAMMKLGESEEDALDYVMVGCYESTSLGREIACTTNGRVSFPKAVEYAMNGGVDLLTGRQIGLPTPREFISFEAFLAAVEAQLDHLAKGCMKRIAAMERAYPEIFTAPLFSAQMASCLTSATDAYDGGAKYNHSSINVFGIATATDALMTIETLVFKRRALTLAELADILGKNWEGAERLRQMCRKQMPKYGNHDQQTDAIAARLMRAAAQSINGKPNGRRGAFRLGSFSIDWRFDFGEHMAASADGRLQGESISKNLSASMGMDKEGATALVLSATALDYSLIPNGAVLDLMLHSSAASGDDGLQVMAGLLDAYFERGGMALQYNIMDAETLRKAQREPQQYANLQVRLCGWNVRFVDLSKREQDELIEQASAAG